MHAVTGLTDDELEQVMDEVRETLRKAGQLVDLTVLPPEAPP